MKPKTMKDFNVRPENTPADVLHNNKVLDAAVRRGEITESDKTRIKEDIAHLLVHRR